MGYMEVQGAPNIAAEYNGRVGRGALFRRLFRYFISQEAKNLPCLTGCGQISDILRETSQDRAI